MNIIYSTVLNISASFSLSFWTLCAVFFVWLPHLQFVFTCWHILFQNVSGSGKDMGQAYVNFTRNCMDQIRSKVNDELWILNFFEVRDILF